MNNKNSRGGWRLRALVLVVALAMTLTTITLLGNDYRVHQQRLSIPTPRGALDAVLTRPTGAPATGLVIIVHGDGPIEATHGGLYLPWFEAAADAGYATLSWSKPGVGGSAGNWLHQSMADRATEVSTVVDWAKDQTVIPTDRIVLWGASQAGWVLPRVASSRDDIAAVVAAGPAINWLRQGRYNLLAELDHEHADEAARAAAIRRSDQTRRLLQQRADYETYRATTDDPDPMDADRWGFVARNHTADATADLTAMNTRHVPVLLMLGAHDRNVDIDETAATYRQILGDDVRIERFDAAHSLAHPIMEDSSLVGLTTGTVWPRALLADNVLATYTAYLRNR